MSTTHPFSTPPGTALCLHVSAGSRTSAAGLKALISEDPTGARGGGRPMEGDQANRRAPALGSADTFGTLRTPGRSFTPPDHPDTASSAGQPPPRPTATDAPSSQTCLSKNPGTGLIIASTSRRAECTYSPSRGCGRRREASHRGSDLLTRRGHRCELCRTGPPTPRCPPSVGWDVQTPRATSTQLESVAPRARPACRQ